MDFTGTTVSLGLYEKALEGEAPFAQFNIQLKAEDIRDNWARAGLTADFMVKQAALSSSRYPTLPNTWSMIINELIENAAKYSAINTLQMKISFRHFHGFLELEVINTCEEEDAQAIYLEAKKALNANSHGAFVSQLEQDITLNETGSGLGFSTILQMDGSLGFKLVPSSTYSGLVDVYISTRLTKKGVRSVL